MNLFGWDDSHQYQGPGWSETGLGGRGEGGGSHHVYRLPVGTSHRNGGEIMKTVKIYHKTASSFILINEAYRV